MKIIPPQWPSRKLCIPIKECLSKLKTFLFTNPFSTVPSVIWSYLNMMQVSSHSTNFNAVLLVNYFHVLNGYLWQDLPTKRCTAEADIHIHNSTVNSSGHKRKNKIKLLLKSKATFHLSFTVGPVCCFTHTVCNRRKLAHYAPPIFLNFKRKGNNRVQERGLQHAVKFWPNWGDSHKASDNGCAHTWQNSLLLSNTCVELISEYRNALESRNNDPFSEGLKTSRNITVFQQSSRK